MGALGMVANGVAPHLEPEQFRDFAFSELQAAPPWRAGLCWRPECQRPFDPVREWQIYCCAACAAAGKAEMRKWGHRMALPLLVWRMVKYEQRDAGLIDLRKVSRRYVTQVQSAWLADRAARAGGAGRCVSPASPDHRGADH